MKRVLMVGAGEIGQALVRAMRDVTVDCWDLKPERCTFTGPLEDRVPGVDMIFLCTPAAAVRATAARIAPRLTKDTVVLCLSKGVEGENLATMDRVLEETLPKRQRYVLLGGPLLAEELDAGKPGVGVFASQSVSAFAVVAPLFAGGPVRLEYTKEVRAVAFAGVLKNVYAVALGIAEGVGWGWNGKGWLATKCLAEFNGVLRVLDGRSEVALSAAGAGDFLATAMSPDSRNREAGRQIARTGTCTSPGEGCKTLPFLLRRLGNKSKRFPILEVLRRIVIGGEDAQEAFEDLLVGK